MKKQPCDDRLNEEIRRRAVIEQDLNLRLRQQEAIASLGENALGYQDLDALFQEAVNCVAETLGMEYCKVLQLMPGRNSLLLRAGVGWKEGLVGHALVGTEMDSQAGYTLFIDEPVIVDNLRTETRFSGPTLLHDHQVVSGMSVVIPGKNGPWGVLGVHSSQQRVFHPQDTRFIKAVANILAFAIQRFSTEEDLRRSRDQLSIILQGISEGVTVQDQHGQLIYANPAAAELMGYPSAEEALEAPVSKIQQRFTLLDEQGNPFPYEKLPGRRVIQGEKRATARVRFRNNLTGEERWSIVDATPILDELGQPVQSVNIFRDITDLVLSEQYQRFLAEAGDLLVSSLDYENTLKHVAHLAVTNLADWCSIHLVSDEQEAFQLTVAHKDPAKLALAEQFQKRYPPDLQGDTGVARVLKTGEPLYYPVISEDLLVKAAQDAEHLTTMRTLGMRSVLIVPLIVRERILGAITLIWAESGHQSSQRDVALSHELARRAALAIDNARLYQEARMTNNELEQRVARRTQELIEANRQLAGQIDERQKTEHALRKSEGLLNSLFASAPDAILLVNQKGSIVRANHQAEGMFGFSGEELVGMSIDSLIPTRFRHGHIKKREQYMRENVARSMGAGLALFALRKDGTEFPVDIMLSPVQTEEGQMVICAVRNITEQKRLQAELAETHRRLFESIEAERLRISQELHDGPIQDLYGVDFSLETLHEIIFESQPLEELQSARTSILGVVQALRDICSELRPPTLSRFGLEKAIRSHLEKVRASHPEIRIEAQLMSDQLLLAERTRLALYRVYQNALSNIIRHANASTIWIDFQVVDGEVLLEIKDNGQGFAVPAKWVDLAREGHFGLVGMAERIEAIGGRFNIESSTGQGTTIRVIVPLEQPITL